MGCIGQKKSLRVLPILSENEAISNLVRNVNLRLLHPDKPYYDREIGICNDNINVMQHSLYLEVLSKERVSALATFEIVLG